MKVFKFGGASVKDAAGVENVATILQLHGRRPVAVVVSAMGSTTNALEKILSQHRLQQDCTADLSAVKHFHATVMQALFPQAHPVYGMIATVFGRLESALTTDGPYDMVYDQVISYGEMLSTIIVHHYLQLKQISCEWIDARDYIATDETFREANVNWTKTCKAMSGLKTVLSEQGMIITQGFIGRSDTGRTTTLGRDGSDFSAAIFASCLGAESVTIWKDVPGVMNADP